MIAFWVSASRTRYRSVEACCSELARRQQLLREDGTARWPDGTLATRYVFRHALYREGLYERVPAGVRANLHARIGERLEAAYGARSADLAVELAMKARVLRVREDLARPQEQIVEVQ